MVQWQNYLKPVGELPKHITFQQYKLLREEKVDKYYNEINMPNKRNSFLKIRDKLLMDFAFATGGRIGDITRVVKDDINFDNKLLSFNIKKTRSAININLDADLSYDILNFIQLYKIEDNLFPITPEAAWYIVKKFGKLINLDLHPHMFRHGLALHLLNQGVPIPVIQYRLGHKDIRTTIQMYLKVTPEIEKQLLQNVQWR